jgi:hypothetical protein
LWRDGSACGPVIAPVFKTGGRRVNPVTGGFDPHSLPPFFNNLQTSKSLANQFGFGKAIRTTLEWASCISFVTTSP